jgi:hypothetical protein
MGTDSFGGGTLTQGWKFRNIPEFPTVCTHKQQHLCVSILKIRATQQLAVQDWVVIRIGESDVTRWVPQTHPIK